MGILNLLNVKKEEGFKKENYDLFMLLNREFEDGKSNAVLTLGFKEGNSNVRKREFDFSNQQNINSMDKKFVTNFLSAIANLVEKKQYYPNAIFLSESKTYAGSISEEKFSPKDHIINLVTNEDLTKFISSFDSEVKKIYERLVSDIKEEKTLSEKPKGKIGEMFKSIAIAGGIETIKK